ncbi:hypothetical protein [Plantibacter sp. MMLR14_011]|uniref:hypothetical protein n=1 Tax=Plantibacter sp. MMLR14_011 TaxID=1898746 RepID=UPI001113E01B|nr:hypothetical protein [Plantibacter sp. MMLR14_011]
MPKSTKRGVPEWTYEPLNLFLSCDSCNSKIKKNFDPLLRPFPTNYRKARFTIIHPYLDRVRDHMTGGYTGGANKPSAPVSHTEKGSATIERFRLTDAGLRNTWEGEYDLALKRQAQSGWTSKQQSDFASALDEVSGPLRS